VQKTYRHLQNQKQEKHFSQPLMAAEALDGK
jgi:hypothetical protein